MRKTYTVDHDESVTEAILDAIEDSLGEELERPHFALFDDIDHEALNDLFHRNSSPRTTVTIATDGIEVELWSDGETYVSVVDKPVESSGRRTNPE